MGYYMIWCVVCVIIFICLSGQIRIHCLIGKMCGVYLDSEYWREYFSSNEFTLSCEDDVHRKRSLWRILCVASLAKLQSLRPKFRCVKIPWLKNISLAVQNYHVFFSSHRFFIVLNISGFWHFWFHFYFFV